MKNPLCRHLDDYLDGFLTASDQAEFEEHLRDCERCQTDVLQQQAVGDAVRRYAVQLQPPRPLMHPAVTERDPAIPSGKRTPFPTAKIAAAIGLAAAVLIMLGAMEIVRRWQPRPITQDVRPQPLPEPIQDIPDSPGPPVRTESVSSRSHLAIVDASESDDFTFVMLYPRVRFDQEQDDEQ